MTHLRTFQDVSRFAVKGGSFEYLKIQSALSLPGNALSVCPQSPSGGIARGANLKCDQVKTESGSLAAARLFRQAEAALADCLLFVRLSGVDLPALGDYILSFKFNDLGFGCYIDFFHE